MAFDIVGSSLLHGQFTPDGRPIRIKVLDIFEECLIRHGGCLESSAGDSAYAHFGMVKELKPPADNAASAASEFRTLLRSFSTQSGVPIECGIGLHFAEKCLVDLTTNKLSFEGLEIVRKSFSTTSPDVDLVHRIEKFAHELPGTNVIMTQAFVDRLSQPPVGLVLLGDTLFKGQTKPVKILLKPSDQITPKDIDRARHKISEPLAKSA
ncbi:MAG: adenylate/guanylate cyclase domain-containing protein [Bdellovibrionaceae bacterium]|nr:adenylate/guanylate cyclase domain-containing protein [Pseudobdellovibrionaceae bacterium]